MFRRFVFEFGLVALACCLLLFTNATADTHKVIDVPPGDLTTALESISKQAGVELVFNPAQLKGLYTKGVTGTMSPQDAVKRLLEGTSLQLSTDSTTGAMMIGEPPPLVPKPIVLEEVLVTGTRLARAAAEGAQEVKVYTREAIDRSGQNSVADFLSTLPDVSLGSSESGFHYNSNFSTTTVQLHGLPVGTTLVLLNGRRIENSGSSYGIGYFDLNSIPAAAVERIEVVSEGSSAVYGSDAIAGVINVILKNDFDGLELRAGHGFADGVQDTNADLAAGKRWEKGSVSVVGTFQSRGELGASERALTSNQDYSAFGGPDTRVKTCDPGNVATSNGNALAGAPAGSNASFAAIAAGAAGNPRQTGFQATYGAYNKCSQYGYSSLLPDSRRYGVMASARYRLTPAVELFTELGFSYVQQVSQSAPPALYGVVPATNPYNPFGQAVTVSGSFLDEGVTSAPLVTNFRRELVGARGNLFDSWQWEVAGWESSDATAQDISPYLNRSAVTAALNSTDPATALNPFVAGAYGSPQLLQSLFSDYAIRYGGVSRVVNGFVRGPLLTLPAGPFDVVIGSEYDRDSLQEHYLPTAAATAATFNFGRNRYAVFGEGRLPILSNHWSAQGGALLAATVAGRFDHYNDFGGVTTPQYGVEFRPTESLLFRATYGNAFKAPDLTNLHGATYAYQLPAVDPLRGKQVETVTVNGGGNPNLQPETGLSRTLGMIYSSQAIANLQFSLTHWQIVENQAIQYIAPQTIIANEALFPGRVIRGPAQNGLPGPITSVDASESNFGLIDVAGFDYHLSYRFASRYGEWSPALGLTQTVHYRTAFTPGAPITDQTSKANDDMDWAPRFKGTASLGWQLAAYSASLDGRYIGRYRDFDPLSNGQYLTLGNFWFIDANVRYGLGRTLAPGNQWLKDLYVEAGGVNLFNKLPQFSNFYSGLIGYDPSQGDIRGRYLYVRFGLKL